MATLSSFKDSLQVLGSRLKAENEANSRERMNVNLNLDFSRERPGSERRPRPSPFTEFQIPGRPNTISARPRGERPRIEPLFFQAPKQSQDSPELNAHVKKISRNKGIITVNSKQYKSTIEDMEYISELGNGTSGSVVKMLHKPSNKLIAVKQMHRSGNLEESRRVFFDLEVVLSSHDCPYIVQCLGCFVTDTDVWICMELMSTCLDKLIKKYKLPFPEPIIGKIAVATLNALHYLKESHGVIHRDVKPSNILLDENGNIKLCDFGISGRLVESKANTRSAGCAAYMAPERIDPPDPNKPDYDIRADVWSLGITLVELATGQFPYKDCKTDFEVLTKVLQDAPPVLSPDQGFSQDFRNFVKDCLAKDYKDRPKYKRLLEYPFIRKYEKEKIDVSKWFKEVNRTIEIRSKTWPQTNLSSPQISRSSRTCTRTCTAPDSAPLNETTLKTPPPVAPRRRSKTPDTHSQDRFNPAAPQLNHHHQPRSDPPPPVPPHPHRSAALSVSSTSPQGSLSRPQVHTGSPAVAGGISASPLRNIPSPVFPRSSIPSSPLHRGGSSDPPLSQFSSSSIPHHQYGVPSSSSQPPHSFSSKHHYYPQGYSQYTNPYTPHSQSPRNHISSNHDSANSPSYYGHTSNFMSSGFNSTNTGETSFRNSPLLNRKYPTNNLAHSSIASSSSSFSHHNTSSSAGATLSSQLARKTPEPVSRYGSYLPPHASPLVSRRFMERRTTTPDKRSLFPHLSTSSNVPDNDSSSSSSLPPLAASPHYRYTQEAYYNSRPYYTPEPQRRIFPRIEQP